MKIYECPYCRERVKIKKVECHKCGISFEGEFYTSPIMALSEEQQGFIELFVLSSGSLKEMAAILGVPVSWLYQRTRLNTIPCVRVGKYVRFEVDTVLAHLKERSQGNAG